MAGQEVVRMTVFINETGQWKTPFVTELPSVEVEASSHETLGEVTERALQIAGVEIEDPHWWWAVAKPDAQGRQMMTHLSAVVANDGAFRWTAGGLKEITVSELRRASEAGFFEGDPNAVCIERMLGGNGPLPGWDELLSWLGQAGVVYGGIVAIKAGVDVLIRLFRRHLGRWRDKRGATTPFAFLDVVLVRDAWRVDELAQLLQIEPEEASDLLISLGYRREATSDPYRLSSDPDDGRLRARMYEQFGRQDPQGQGPRDDDVHP